jgi:hypothetical protein
VTAVAFIGSNALGKYLVYKRLEYRLWSEQRMPRQRSRPGETEKEEPLALQQALHLDEFLTDTTLK